MNIKIIEPYDFNKRFDTRSLTPNLGPAIIGSLLKQEGHDVEVISEYITNLNINEINLADIVGISITTYNAKKGFEIAQSVSKPIVFGGFHASLMPEECLKYGDYVIRGDGHPIVKLVALLGTKKSEDLQSIPNLVFKKDDEFFYNQTETKSINIIPDFSIVKDYYKINLNRLLRIPLTTNASRGCYHKCTFCSVKEVYRDFKKKDFDIVISDIKSQIHRQHFFSKFLPKAIWITDDNFFSDLGWAKKMLAELAKLKTDYKLVIQMRADVAQDDQILELLKSANVSRIYLGIESINQRGLEKFKKNSSLEVIRYAINNIKKHEIDIYGLFVFGDDEFQKGDGKKVAKFVKEHGLTGILIQPLTPFPGTRLFWDLKERGRILHEDWQDYNGKVVIAPKNLTAIELQKEVYDCYREVYSPLRIAKYLFSKKGNLKIGLLGEAIFRHFEWFKSRNYIREKFISI